MVFIKHTSVKPGVFLGSMHIHDVSMISLHSYTSHAFHLLKHQTSTARAVWCNMNRMNGMDMDWVWLNCIIFSNTEFSLVLHVSLMCLGHFHNFQRINLAESFKAEAPICTPGEGITPSKLLSVWKFPFWSNICNASETSRSRYMVLKSWRELPTSEQMDGWTSDWVWITAKNTSDLAKTRQELDLI